MKKILFLIFFLCANYVFAQDTTVTTPIDTNEKVFTIVEVMPAFPGGNEELFKFLAKNIAYPVSKKENVMSGKVYVQFIVEKEGSLTNIKILKTFDDNIADEVIRVIRLMPKWIPGKQNGKLVRVFYNLPITIN